MACNVPYYVVSSSVDHSEFQGVLSAMLHLPSGVLQFHSRYWYYAAVHLVVLILIILTQHICVAVVVVPRIK